jgi:hypothetical protein
MNHQKKSILNIKPVFTKSLKKNCKTYYTSINTASLISGYIYTYITTPKPNLNYPSYDKEFRIFLNDDIRTFHIECKEAIEEYIKNCEQKIINGKLDNNSKKEYENMISVWYNACDKDLYPDPLKTLLEDYDYTYNITYGENIQIFNNQVKLYEEMSNGESLYINTKLNGEIDKASIDEATMNTYLETTKILPSYIKEYFNYKKENNSKKLKEEDKGFAEFYLSKLQQDNDREIKVKIKPYSIKLSTQVKDEGILRRGSQVLGAGNVFETVYDVDFTSPYDAKGFPNRLKIPNFNANNILVNYTIVKRELVVNGVTKVFKQFYEITIRGVT